MASNLPGFDFHDALQKADTIAEHGTGWEPYAAYALYEMDEREASRAHDAINTNKEPDAPDIARIVQLGNASITQAFETHHKMMTEHDVAEPAGLPYEYGHILCLMSAEWYDTGALLIDISLTSKEKARGFYCNVAEIASALANLQIANMDFEELEEMADMNVELARHIASIESQHPATTERERRIRDRLAGKSTYGIFPDVPPLIGQFLATYVGVDIDTEPLPDLLSYPRLSKRPDDEYTCRIFSLSPTQGRTTAELIDEASKLHSHTQTTAPFWPNQYLIIDEPDLDRKGILHVLEDPANDQARQTHRREAKQVEAKIQSFATGAQDYAPAYHTFACFTLVQRPGLLQLLGEYEDARVHHRPKFEKGPLAAPNPPAALPGVRESTYGWDEAARKFRVMCRVHRFDDQFDKKLFLVADQADGDVALVRMEWEFEDVAEADLKDVEKGWQPDMLTELEVERCDPRMAYQMLCDLADGKRDWEGVNFTT